MLRTKMLLTAAAAAVWTGCASAQGPAVADPEAALFGARESAVGLDISASGQFVSYVAPASGGGAVAFIADVQSGESKASSRAARAPNGSAGAGSSPTAG